MKLAAVDGADVPDLPMTVVKDADAGVVTIEFDRGGLMIDAVPLIGKEPAGDITQADGLYVVSLVIGVNS